MSNEIITNFTSGEITPQADARDDIEKYAGACRRLENMIPDVYGNATKRPGTEFVAITTPCVMVTDTLTLDHIVAISTALGLQKMGSFQATFASASGTIALGETITYQTTKTALVVDIIYATAETGTVWWRWAGTATVNIENGNICNHGADTITINSVPESNLTKNYYLTGNIDASDTSSWYGGLGFLPIGYINYTPQRFTGTFDGCGYTISNLTINTTELRAALFNTCSNATIYNLKLIDTSVTSSQYSGSLVGFAINTILHTVTSTNPVITGHSLCAGLIGGEGGGGAGNTIYNCHVVNATVTGTGAGTCALFGVRMQGTYTYCSATGTVKRGLSTAGNSFGGFMASVPGTYASSFEQCTTSGILPIQLPATNPGGEVTNGGFMGSSDAAANYVNCSYLSSMNELPFGGEDEVQTISAIATPNVSYTITFDGISVSAGYPYTQTQTQLLFDAVFGTGVIEVCGDYPIQGNRSQKIYFRKRYSRTNVAMATITSQHTITTTNEAVYPTVSSNPTIITDKNKLWFCKII